MNIRSGHRMIHFLFLAIAMFGAQARAMADQDTLVVDRVVHPTGRFPEDVRNVQAATDLGGTVLLKATSVAGQPMAFNFGSPEPILIPVNSVYLHTDVTIVGEQAGNAMTRIRGGWVPILVFEPVQVGIRGIHFDGPLEMAIWVFMATGVEITDNRISDVVGNQFSYTHGRGISLLGDLDPDGAITGRVRIAGNTFERLGADISQAIFLYQVAADITEIDGNRVTGSNSGGITVYRQMKGSVSIERNVIAPGVGNGGPFSAGNGIHVEDVHGSNYSINYSIRHNRIVCDNPSADGILLISDSVEMRSPIIEKNEILMTDTQYGAIRLLGWITDAYVAHNQIRGKGALALGAIGGLGGEFGDYPLVGSIFDANNHAQYQAYFADVFLDGYTRDSILVGYSGSVVDLGTNNRVTGYTNLGGAHLGRQLRDAVLAKRQALIQMAGQPER